MTRQEAELLVDRLAANWPKAEIPAAKRMLYVGCIADLPFELGEMAVFQALTTRKWFPEIAELRALAAELYQDADGRPTPEEAWEEFRRAPGKYGAYQTPEWSHPAVERAAKTIGYRDFCMSDVKDTSIWRAQFLKVYDHQQERETRDMVMLPQVKQLVGRLRLERGHDEVRQLEDVTASGRGGE